MAPYTPGMLPVEHHQGDTMSENGWKAVALVAIGWAALATAAAWNNARTVDQVTGQLTAAKREAAAVPAYEPPSPIREARPVRAVRDEPGTRCVDGLLFRVSGGTVEQVGTC